jgi:hypothetical protein
MASMTSLAKGSISQITRNWEPLATGFLNELYNLARVRLFRRQVIDRNICAFARIGYCCRAPHARVSAGDEGLSAR